MQIVIGDAFRAPLHYLHDVIQHSLYGLVIPPRAIKIHKSYMELSIQKARVMRDVFWEIIAAHVSVSDQPKVLRFVDKFLDLKLTVAFDNTLVLPLSDSRTIGSDAFFKNRLKPLYEYLATPETLKSIEGDYTRMGLTSLATDLEDTFPDIFPGNIADEIMDTEPREIFQVWQKHMPPSLAIELESFETLLRDDQIWRELEQEARRWYRDAQQLVGN